MIDKHENKLRMYFAVSAVCECNVDLWLENETFAQAYERFQLKIPEIQKCRDILALELIAGETLKSVDRVELEEMAFYVSGKIASYAREIKNQKLYDETHINRSNLDKATDPELINISNIIVKDALVNLISLQAFNISADLIMQFQNIILNYSNNVTKFKHFDARTKHTEDHLKKLYRDADDLLKNKLDANIDFFKTRYPEFYQQYIASREIIEIEFESETVTRIKGKMVNMEI